MLRLHFKDREEVVYELPDDYWTGFESTQTVAGGVQIDRVRTELRRQPVPPYGEQLVMVAREFVDSWGPESGWYRLENTAADDCRPAAPELMEALP